MDRLVAVASKSNVVSGGVIMDWVLATLLPAAVVLVLKIVGIFIIWFIGGKLIKLARKIAKKMLEKGHAEQGVISFLDNFLKYALYILLIVIILSIFKVDTTSIAAAVASAGVAIGLALQGSLSNLAGGVLILLLRPFRIGDYIVAGGVEGTVSEIKKKKKKKKKKKSNDGEIFVNAEESSEDDGLSFLDSKFYCNSSNSST